MKRNGAPFTPESSTRLSPCLKKYLKRKGSPFTLLNHQQGILLASYYQSNFLLPQKILPMTQVQILNYLLPKLSAFTSPVPADILLDDDFKRSHQTIKKQGRPPKNQRKRNAATAPKFMPAVHQQSWRLSLDVHQLMQMLGIPKLSFVGRVERRKH